MSNGGKKTFREEGLTAEEEAELEREFRRRREENEELEEDDQRRVEEGQRRAVSNGQDPRYEEWDEEDEEDAYPPELEVDPHGDGQERNRGEGEGQGPSQTEPGYWASATSRGGAYRRHTRAAGTNGQFPFQSMGRPLQGRGAGQGGRRWSTSGNNRNSSAGFERRMGRYDRSNGPARWISQRMHGAIDREIRGSSVSGPFTTIYDRTHDVRSGTSMRGRHSHGYSDGGGFYLKTCDFTVKQMLLGRPQQDAFRWLQYILVYVGNALNGIRAAVGMRAPHTDQAYDEDEGTESYPRRCRMVVMCRLGDEMRNHVNLNQLIEDASLRWKAQNRQASIDFGYDCQPTDGDRFVYTTNHRLYQEQRAHIWNPGFEHLPTLSTRFIPTGHVTLKSMIEYSRTEFTSFPRYWASTEY